MKRPHTFEEHLQIPAGSEGDGGYLVQQTSRGFLLRNVYFDNGKAAKGGSR